MVSRMVAVVVNCRDAEALAAFWAGVLGARGIGRWDDPRGTRYVQLDDTVPVLLFQPVPDPPSGNNRLHLDVAAPQPQADEVARLVGLGAAVVDDAPDLPWVVLADPEGNEFCVLPSRGT